MSQVREKEGLNYLKFKKEFKYLPLAVGYQ